MKDDLCIDLGGLFSATSGTEVLSFQGVNRRKLWLDEQIALIRDGFPEFGADCVFIRIGSEKNLTCRLELTGGYRIASCVAGGWLLCTEASDLPLYWIPQPPVIRTLDVQQRILEEQHAQLLSITADTCMLSTSIAILAGQVLDLTLWRFNSDAVTWASELDDLLPIETQSYFTYASHTTFNRPADLYRHLIHGFVYETVWGWPKQKKICDELDAYALYLICAGLRRASGKHLYRLFMQQLAASVIARQQPDGGWRHGEWTELMEEHLRLSCGGLHLLAAAAEEEEGGALALNEALRRGAAHLALQTDQINSGSWLLHDSLERSESDLSHGPFTWVSSRVLGKSPSNMLVLNTQLDGTIALDRARQILGEKIHNDLIASAQKASKAVLAARPAEWFYNVIYRAVALTLLPEDQARALPAPVRIIKRLTWKYLYPQLNRIKTALPRFVMPNGYIERDLALGSFSHAYQSVNIWDLARFRHRFGGDYLDPIIDLAARHTQLSGMRAFWKQGKGQHALGFWTEALYHLCLQDSRPEYRAWLAESMFDVTDAGLGLPPSTLGACAEVIAPATQHATPSPMDPRIRIANLSRGGQIEFLVINTAQEALPFTLLNLPQGITWSNIRDGVLGGRSWTLGIN
ncbi:MAG: hypothetical protein KJ958_12320 [Gammaproteobacteria bacterium]|nr:hypothetical protein [Gammaproteobacteria bacterium]MBU1979942.1 hypothetical protein [Gammaproteobacteria bacterium]